MQLRRSMLGWLSLLLVLAAGGSAAAQSQPVGPPYKLFLPLALGQPLPLSPFGFDLRPTISDAAVGYVTDARAKWARAGDVLWSDIEPVRGGGYHWEAMADVDANIRRLRAAGVEPTLVVQRTPAWAQRTPGRLCSPPKPEYVGDFARFMRALAARYASGPAAVNYWEIWNEPEFTPAQAPDAGGYGCWGDPNLPDHGGAYYGEVLKQVYPAIKSANPRATVLGGALYYWWPNDAVSRAFLEGMLKTGAGQAFDALSFHAYGEWGAGDLLINKTIRLRAILKQYGLPNKPLFATEIAAMCASNTSCPPNFLQSQANYAARIYAEAMALNLQGAFWFTLALNNPGYQYSHLIDSQNGTLAPRQAYYSFRNTARLLQGSTYIGPPIAEPAPSQMSQVQVLIFQKPNSRLYVLWVPQTDFPVYYELQVAPGAGARCTDHLDWNPYSTDPTKRPQTYDCSDTNRDGRIPRAINELPQYVEVMQ
jgi:hypothetical protein